MKKIILLLTVFITQLGNAQVDKSVSIFHRLIILNQNNELLVVKIKNTDVWVTPGLYQNNEQTIKQGLDSISMTYGFKTENPELRGMFILRRDINGETTTSLRSIFTAKLISGELKKPEGIAEIKWLTPEKSFELITFPHINVMIEQVLKHPKQVWGGTLIQFKENNIWKTKILEDFYVLSETKD